MALSSFFGKTIFLGFSGADIHKKDKTGRTPLDIVKSRLNTLRQDRSISTDKLIGECQMVSCSSAKN